MDKLPSTIAGEICLSKDPGSSMRKWREIFGISQTELANFLKVSSSTISDYEGGRRKSPGIHVVSRFVMALIRIDKNKGGPITKQLEKDFKPKEEAFDTHEFYASMQADKFIKKLEATCVANPSKLKNAQIYGYTIVDSLKVILDVPVHEYMQIYGKTPERALIFKHVENGRSPLIAVKIGRFSTEMKPAMVILHGDLKPSKVDPVAIRIAESEKIPLLVTSKPIGEIVGIFKKYES